MHRDDVTALFDQSAPNYDAQWHKLAAIRDTLHLLMKNIVAALPERASVLCVGAGTGAEMINLAESFPLWTFTAVEPSQEMVSVCRQHLENRNLTDRCTIHNGFLDSFSHAGDFDAATSLLVSQFIIDHAERTQFFADIASRLKPGGLLVSADLCTDLHSPGGQSLTDLWLTILQNSGVDADRAREMREDYNRDLSIRPADEVAELIASAGYAAPVCFFQAGLIHALYTHKTSPKS